jgi:hypothetical protein
MREAIANWLSGLKIADFVTAIATSATAFFAWLAYRLAARSNYPIVECDEPKWMKDNRRILMNIRVRNRAAIAYLTSTLEIQRPKGSTMRLPDSNIGPAKILDVSWRTLQPIEAGGHAPRDPFGYSLSEALFNLVIEPPASFLSGKLRIVLTASDKSIKPRQRRFVISKFIQAAKTKTTADIANKTD